MGRSTKIIGDALKKRREAVCLTQTQLGEKLGGMSDENIGAIERANPPRGILSKRLPALAEALQMSMDDLKRELVATGKAQKTLTLKLNGDLSQAVESRARELEVAPNDWAISALQAVLAVEDWKPGMALAVKPVKMVETGRPQRDAAKKKPEK